MQLSKKNFDCAVIGDWHLAFITAAGLADLGNRVLLVNPHPDRPWKEFPRLQLNEPNLSETIEKAQANDRLSFTNAIDSSWDAKFVWLAIDTPVDEEDRVDLSPLRRAAEAVAKAKARGQRFVVTSQVPLGFCGELEKDFGLEVAYVPENLRLGQGLKTFLEADRLVIGARLPEFREAVHGLFKGVPSDVFTCDLPTAEMIKHATNIFLATSISLSNEIAMVGESYSVDGVAVGKALGLDKRIGKKAYVIPGLGFAGGTLPRDLRALQALGKKAGISTRIADAVLDVNTATNDAIVFGLEKYLGSLSGKNILLCGYAYKPEIDTLRRSPAIEIAKMLKKKGAQILGFDPLMNAANLADLDGWITHLASLEQISGYKNGLDAVVVMTGRPSFRGEFKQASSLDFLQRNRGQKEKQLLFFDTIGCVDAPEIQSAGLAFKQLWRPISGLR